MGAFFVSFSGLPNLPPNFPVEHDVANLVTILAVNLASRIPTHVWVVFVSDQDSIFVFLVQASTKWEVVFLSALHEQL